MATDIKKEIERLRDEIREHIRELGVCGPVSVERFDGKRLPYAENLVNLVVAEDLGGVTMEETMRVLVPGGVVYFNVGSYLPRGATLPSFLCFDCSMHSKESR